MLWAIPLLAAALVALLRYSFGSLFVVGEQVVMALLGVAGGDVAGTVQRLQDHPFAAVLITLPGLLAAGAAMSLAFTAPLAASGLALASGGWAWWAGDPLTSYALLPAVVAGLAGLRAAKP